MTSKKMEAILIKKQKKNYNRIYQFGNRAGKTCCIISDEQNIARSLVNLLVDAPAIGQCFLLIEPTTKQSQALRQDMPVIQTSMTMLPLKDQFIISFPIIIPRPPTLANETTFFVLHNLKL